MEFGRYNLGKFRKMGMLRNGVPSEATLCRVDNGIDDLAMADRMQRFVEVFHGELLKNDSGKEIICVDGKAERGTVQDNGRSPDIVSAYSYNTGITLATEACSEKSNEIKAIPRLIDKINISGKIVTADAMSMQKNIIDRIRENGGDFSDRTEKQINHLCVMAWRTGSKSALLHILTQRDRNLGMAE
ncbi:MAG: ISAs1 family transposase [Porphyromonadaceae bacterium]|nr:MAG: ISAs1 family transposase [Porphyromonadaceae bacterium]